MRWSHIPALVTPTWLVTSHGKLQSTNNWLPTTTSDESSPSWWPREALKQKCLQHSYCMPFIFLPSSYSHDIHMIALLQQLLPICCSKWQFNPNSYQWHVMRCWVVTYIRYAISTEPTILVLSAYVARILLNNIQHPTIYPSVNEATTPFSIAWRQRPTRNSTSPWEPYNINRTCLITAE